MQLILSFVPPAGAKGDETGKVDAQVSRKLEIILSLSQKSPKSN